MFIQCIKLDAQQSLRAGVDVLRELARGLGRDQVYLNIFYSLLSLFWH